MANDPNPGELVLRIEPREDGVVAVPGWRWGLVIGIAYPRRSHMGCEERVDVLWSDPASLERVCDCVLLVELLRHSHPTQK